MPLKRMHHMKWHGIGFKKRTLIFTCSILFMFCFVFISFCLGAQNGSWILEKASWIMSWTLMPIAKAMQNSNSITMQLAGNGLSTFASVDGISIFMSIFILSIICVIIISFVIDMIQSIRYARDDGNIAVLKNYNQQYRMGTMLK